MGNRAFQVEQNEHQRIRNERAITDGCMQEVFLVAAEPQDNVPRMQRRSHATATQAPTDRDNSLNIPLIYINVTVLWMPPITVLVNTTELPLFYGLALKERRIPEGNNCRK